MEKLIDNWLLAENKEYYRVEAGKEVQIVLQSLGMSVNLWVGIASLRFKGKYIGVNEVENVLAIIVSLDEEKLQWRQEDILKWLRDLKDDDNTYIAYCHHLISQIKTKVFTQNHSGLPLSIKETWEFKEWMKEQGYEMVSIQLKDNWMHPLSSSEVVGNNIRMNSWLLASILLAVASGRLDQDTKGQFTEDYCISQLVKMQIFGLEEDINLRLEVARLIDSEYLNLISEVNESLLKAHTHG